jgi:hypothetical protein
MATLLFSLFLAVIVGASLSRCLFTWKNIGISYRHDCALHVAESGIEQALFALNHQDLEDLDSYGDTGFDAEVRKLAGHGPIDTLSGELNTPDGETFGTFVADVYVDPATPDRAIITSTGQLPALDPDLESRDTRTVRVVVHKTIINPEIWGSAIYAETLLSMNGITEVHGDAIVGENLDGSANLDLSERITSFLFEYKEWFNDDTNDGIVGERTGEVDVGRNLDTDPDNNVVLPFDEFILDQFKMIAMAQGNYYDTAPNDERLPKTFYRDDGSPNIVFITDTLKITGNAQLGGIIFVVGDVYGEREDLALGGTIDIDGIMYTSGAFRTLGGGAAGINLNGAVFGAAADLTGNAVVEYNWEYIEALRGWVFDLNNYRFYSWQELLPNQDTGEAGGGVTDGGTVIAQPLDPTSDPSIY